MVILFSILAAICLILLIIGLIKPQKVLPWVKAEKRKKSTAAICYGIGLVVFCAIAFIIYNNEAQQVTIETVTIEETETYPGIYDLSAIDVTNDAGTEKEGQRGQAYFNKNDMTVESLTNFYNNVVANSGYKYFTLINSDNTSKGIVFDGCNLPATYGDLNSAGQINGNSTQFNLEDYSADKIN